MSESTREPARGSRRAARGVASRAAAIVVLTVAGFVAPALAHAQRAEGRSDAGSPTSAATGRAATSPAAAESQAAPNRVLPATALPGTPTGFEGYTFCRNGLAESWVRADKIGTPELEGILAHEAVHREQAAQFATCEDWLASLGSARRVIEVELPAYCAQLRVAVRRGGDAEELRREYAFRIAAQSGAMENRLDVLVMFKDRCALDG